MTHLTRIRRSASREDGFTMIVAILMLLITSLLVTAAFVSANGDIKLTHTDTNQKKAYYAALAGITAYRYKLNSNANYWRTCPSIPQVTMAGTTDEKYTVKTQPSTGHSESECKSGKQSAILETTGSAVGAFAIKSTGTAGSGTEKTTRSLVATFTHPGFLNYVYLTNYEILDPAAQSPEPTNCEHYYAYRKANNLLGEPPNGCGAIEFAPEDKINGPMHTNDAAEVCATSSSAPTFGRTSADKIEMNGGHYAASGCSNSPNILGTYTESGPTLTPPETDDELLETADDKFKGRTIIELKAGSPNTMAVTTNGEQKLENFPANGVIYVENNGSCSIKYTPFNSNYEGDEKCGNVYVKGEYTEGLTIAAQNDVIINGNLTTTAEKSGKPTGSATLGLIATNFVRIYHPVRQTYEATHSTPKEKSSESSGVKTESTKTVKTERTYLTTSYTPSSYTTNTATPTGNHNNKCQSGFEYISGESLCIETCKTGYAYAGNKICLENCKSGYSYLSSKKTCVTTTCSPGTYIGEGECAVCPSGDTYISSKKECATQTCTSGTYIGNSECAYCSTGYTYITSKKECLNSTCSNGYTYVGNGECKGCGTNNETYEPTKQECEKCSTNDTYASGTKCKYENSSSGCDAENAKASEDTLNHWGYLENPTIDAAILSTAHSFIVDNFKCGKHMGELNVWGAIAQFWRGTVGQGEHGYTKNYNYDERLVTLQPPDFLTPSSSTLKLSRITAPPS